MNLKYNPWKIKFSSSSSSSLSLSSLRPHSFALCISVCLCLSLSSLLPHSFALCISVCLSVCLSLSPPSPLCSLHLSSLFLQRSVFHFPYVPESCFSLSPSLRGRWVKVIKSSTCPPTLHPLTTVSDTPSCLYCFPIVSLSVSIFCLFLS